MRRVALMALVWTLAACSAAPRPCVSPGTCTAGRECLANRCVPEGGEPVPKDTRRLVAEPSEMVVVDRKGVARELGPALVLGSRVRGTTTLYLRFDAVWHRARDIESAFLLLEPMPGTPPDGSDVPVEVWRVRERWSPAGLTRVVQPALGPPSAAGVARASPPQTLRIDVTAIIRHLAEHPTSDQGLALRASGGAGHGASFGTGAAGFGPPRLEVYLR
jgi:hypothetical protein